MPTLSLRTNGLDQVRVGFAQFAATIAPVSRADTYAALQEALKKSPGYQGGDSYSVPNGSTGPNGTPRTGNLGRSVQLEQDGISSRLSVNAYSRDGYEYGPKVLGYADGSGQASYNSHWPTLRSAVDEQVDLLTQKGGKLDSDLQDAANGAGL